MALWRKRRSGTEAKKAAITASASASMAPVLGSVYEARALDHRLHGLVARAARNIHLGELSRDLTARATLGLGAEPYPQEYYERALEDHVELIGHVVAGREEEAARAAEVHFSLTLEIMVDALHSARDSMRE